MVGRPSVGRPQQTTALIAVLPFWLHDGAVQPGDARGEYLLNQSYKNEHLCKVSNNHTFPIWQS